MSDGFTFVRAYPAVTSQTFQGLQAVGNVLRSQWFGFLHDGRLLHCDALLFLAPRTATDTGCPATRLSVPVLNNWTWSAGQYGSNSHATVATAFAYLEKYDTCGLIFDSRDGAVMLPTQNDLRLNNEWILTNWVERWLGVFTLCIYNVSNVKEHLCSIAGSPFRFCPAFTSHHFAPHHLFFFFLFVSALLLLLALKTRPSCQNSPLLAQLLAPLSLLLDSFLSVCQRSVLLGLSVALYLQFWMKGPLCSSGKVGQSRRRKTERGRALFTFWWV